MHSRRAWCAFISILMPSCASAAVLTVGPDGAYQTIAAAVAASADGDEIDVASGTYVNDFAEITTKITLVATGGRVTMQATEQLPNGKGILVTDTDIGIDGFDFEGAAVADGNGAGIRYQAGTLTLTACWFHDNQEGLLANADPNGAIIIRDSEFDHNGIGDGYTHNLYVDQVARLTFTDSYSHDANLGHELKSRALSTTITDSRFAQNYGNTSSYDIDLPNGGAARITGSNVEKGPHAGNPVMIAYGEEGGVPDGSSLALVDVLLANHLQSHTPVGVWNAAAAPLTLARTEVFGLTQAELIDGPGIARATEHLKTSPVISHQHPWLR